MNIFQVHDPALQIRQPLFLEASAGTGKTYSIENIVTRALLEPAADGGPPLTLDQILLVTFTKAAARDLKTRIQANLHKTKKSKEVREALLQFDQAAISTIHAFCYRALIEFGTSSGVLLHNAPELLSQELVWEVIERYFRQEMGPELLTPHQLSLLLQRHGGQVSQLAKGLVYTLSRGISIKELRSNRQGLQDFMRALDQLKRQGWTPSSILNALMDHASQFYGVCDKSKEVKQEFAKAFSYFSSLLDKQLLFSDLEPLLDQQLSSLREVNLKKKGVQPLLCKQIEETICPILEELGSYNALYARIAKGAQKLLFQTFEEIGSCDFGYLLMKMEQLTLSSSAFRDQMRSKYRMVIIDEFQDTDPLQWNIFKTLFHQAGIALILVGDPKQSIYSFRSADIYTYLEARNVLGPSCTYALNTNYRSSPALVSALNHLFKAPGWMQLPFLRRELPYMPVQAAPGKQNRWKEAAISFLSVEAPQMALEEIEEKYLFPRFLVEVQRLHTELGTPYKEIAFLVRDHAQSERLLRYFLKFGLPAHQLRSASLNQARILPDLILLLKALLQPRNLSALQAALGSCFFNWHYAQLESLKDPHKLAEVYLYFHEWHISWHDEGIGHVFQHFLATRFLQSEWSLRDYLIGTQEGTERYYELMLLLEWMIAQDLTPLDLLKELEALQGREPSYQESMKMRSIASHDAVSILTLHMSKGLEFDVVFALGVINRTPLDNGLIPVRDQGKISLVPLPQSQNHLEEKDAEKARQLYVALTRAREKLFIPLVSGWKAPSLGAASPLELLLARHAAPQASWKELYDYLQQPFEEGLSHPDIAQEKLQPLEMTTRFQIAKPPLVPPPSFRLNLKPRAYFSFTTLAKRAAEESRLEHVPHDFFDVMRSPHHLPAGNVTGDLLHQMLEEITWEEVRNSSTPDELLDFVQRYTSATPYAAWNSVIAEMLFNAFKQPLGKSNIRLDHLDESCTFREMEFLYPSPLAVQEEGLVKGVIDLLFCFENRYYLLDWKSNWLGPTQEHYTLPHLEAAIKTHQYDLQAALYRTAVKQYLQKIDPRPFSSCFGGIFYLFLRGFDGTHGLFYLEEP